MRTSPGDPSERRERFYPWYGLYDKTMYDIKLLDGTIIDNCWPNAGLMMSIDGSGRSWTIKEVAGFRCAINHKRF